VMLRWPVGPLRPIKQFSENVLCPLLAPCSLVDLLGISVLAGVGEEMLFRGFLFRGFVHERRDALPGILAISLIWSLLHVQYDWFGAALVFAIGVFLGYMRFLSGSTTLVILLHMLLNLESVAETVFVLGWV